MDVKSDLKSLIREHIEHQLALQEKSKQKSPGKIPSFYKLKREDQEKLIAYELQSPDGYDMIDNHDGPSVMQLLFNCIALDKSDKRKITKEQVVDSLMASLIKRYGANIDEMFDAEFERHTEEQNENDEYEKYAESLPVAQYCVNGI